MKLRNKKTGEIVEFAFTNHESRDFMNYIFEEWENIPKEPLIKDEKIRKAVRAWAKANELWRCYHQKYGDETCYFIACDYDGGETQIWFNMPILELKDDKLYTIAELCGEEGE